MKRNNRSLEWFPEGRLTTQSTTLNDTNIPLNLVSKKAWDKSRTDCCSAAGCFTMQLSLTSPKLVLKWYQTKCDIDFVDGTILTSHLTLRLKSKNN
jgi:osmotically inducible protein OsmC